MVVGELESICYRIKYTEKDTVEMGELLMSLNYVIMWRKNYGTDVLSKQGQFSGPRIHRQFYSILGENYICF